MVGAAILVFALWLGKGYRYGQEFYSVPVMFPEVGALSPGDPVAVSGVNKGTVQKISLNEGGVLAELDVASDVKLKEDATFIVKNIGLMGERFVSVRTGKSESPLDTAIPAIGSFDPGIPEVMGMMGDVIGNLNHLVLALEKTVISPQTLDRFSETISNLQSLTSRLEAATKRNVPKIDTAITHMSDISKSLQHSLQRNQPHLDQAAKNFDSVSVRLMAMLDVLDSASLSLKSFTNDLDQSDGTMRLLMEDRRLYDDLRTTAKRLDSLVTDVRANPKKYINFSVELF